MAEPHAVAGDVSGAEPSGAGPSGAGAVEAALRALRHRDLSAADLERRLADGGFPGTERAHALATMRRTGLVDDRRYAESRAASLAGRGAGDALIRHDLAQSGVAGTLVDEAVEALEPEADRARRIVDRRGPGPKTDRYLRGKGFSEEIVAALGAEVRVARRSRDELG